MRAAQGDATARHYAFFHRRTGAERDADPTQALK